ncbi:TonB C-terminal domain-containing protein [Sulfurimonas sp.]|uniref:TonB C-terminal domain-containing protein n=1 Tax=Sulfurimonas sp. TaxID=2022749 RepID=UPI003565C627
MVKNDYYFYISGAISLFLFLVVTLSFSYMLFSASDIKSYALNKKDFISVSLSTDISKFKVKPAQTQDITMPDKIEENVNIDDLFSDVWTKNISKPKKIKEKTDNKRYNEIAKKVKTSKINEVESIREKIKSIDSSNNSDKSSSDSGADEVNEYLAKIQATIYNHFEPPQNTQGKSAEVIIELSAIGKMIDFRILKFSDNVSFNNELKKIKNRLKNVVFPKNPNNKNYTLRTYIISDKE